MERAPQIVPHTLLLFLLFCKRRVFASGSVQAAPLPGISPSVTAPEQTSRSLRMCRSSLSFPVSDHSPVLAQDTLTYSREKFPCRLCNVSGAFVTI